MDDLLTRVQTEADQCRNDGADDIARLLDEVTAEVKARRSRIDELVSELVDLVAENEALRSHAVPASMALVPVEPTIEMQVAGFESEAWDALSDAVLAKKGWPYSCRQSAECVSAIWRAMLAAAPGTPSLAPAPELSDEDILRIWRKHYPTSVPGQLTIMAARDVIAADRTRQAPAVADGAEAWGYINERGEPVKFADAQQHKRDESYLRMAGLPVLYAVASKPPVQGTGDANG